MSVFCIYSVEALIEHCYLGGLIQDGASVLGTPSSWALYCLEYQISYHCYADNIQIHFQLSDDLPASLNHLSDCLREFTEWLSANSLILNEKKTEIMVFDSHTPRDQLAARFGPFACFLPIL